MKVTGVLAISLIALSVAGCEQEPEANSTDGQELFNYYCAGCHKASGKGSFLEGIPANRTTKLSEVQITELILHGKSQMPDMPSFQLLSQQQARNIAKYLTQTLAKE